VKITSIDHVQLSMPSGRESDAEFFYSEVLGMSVVPKPEALQRRGADGSRVGLLRFTSASTLNLSQLKKRIQGSLWRDSMSLWRG